MRITNNNIIGGLLDRLAAAELAIVELQRSRGRGPQDQADAALLVLAEATAGRPFTAAALLLHAKVNPPLADMLRLVDTPRQTGKLLARLAAHEGGPIRLDRVRMISGMWQWAAVVVSRV